MKFIFLLPTLFFAVWLNQTDVTSRENKLSNMRSNNDNPVELGKVKWLRNLEDAKVQSAKTDKPILLLFQEVPGCSTCQHYGTAVLSHPLVVEAIEDLFVPLAIHNNKKGHDAQVLQIFGEPAWNNPVVRIIDAQGDNVVARLSANYSLHGLVNSMVLALQVSGKEIPQYLTLLHQELSAETKGTKEANLAMYCFWSGEKNLGKLEGVVETQAGFMNGHEVVKVKYNPEVISLTDLVKEGQQTRCADQVFVDDAAQQKQAAKVLGAEKIANTGNFRLDKETKYYLSHSHYRYVPMTQLQAARVNSLLANQQSPNPVLSNRQKELAVYIAEHPKAAWKNQINTTDLAKAWEEVEARRKP